MSNVAGFFLETLDKSVSLFEAIFPDFSEYEKIPFMRSYKKIWLRFKVISKNVGDFLIFLPDFFAISFF